MGSFHSHYYPFCAVAGLQLHMFECSWPSSHCCYGPNALSGACMHMMLLLLCSCR